MCWMCFSHVRSQASDRMAIIVIIQSQTRKAKLVSNYSEVQERMVTPFSAYRYLQSSVSFRGARFHYIRHESVCSYQLA